jgi:hypothetical protein
LRKRFLGGGDEPRIEPRDIRIGTSMARAHQLEQTQEWIGGALDAGVPRNSMTAKWTIEYPVPLKSSWPLLEPRVAVNWIGPNCSRQEIEDALQRATEEAGLSDAAKTKLHNALQFVGFVYDTAQFAPILGPPAP